MLDRSAKGQKISGPQIINLPLCAVAYMSLQHLHGVCAIDVMFLHLGSSFHRYQNDPKILLLIKSSGVDTRGPRLALFGLDYFAQQFEVSEVGDHRAIIV